jgi:hypothetical protein
MLRYAVSPYNGMGFFRHPVIPLCSLKGSRNEECFSFSDRFLPSHLSSTFIFRFFFNLEYGIAFLIPRNVDLPCVCRNMTRNTDQNSLLPVAKLLFLLLHLHPVINIDNK